MKKRKQLTAAKAQSKFVRAQHVNAKNFNHLDRIKHPEMYRGGIRL